MSDRPKRTRGKARPVLEKMRRLLERLLLSWLTKGQQAVHASGTPMTDERGEPLYRPLNAAETVCVLRYLTLAGAFKSPASPVSGDLLDAARRNFPNLRFPPFDPDDGANTGSVLR